MKKKKLMTPYLTSLFLLISACMGTTVYADEAVPEDEMVTLVETISNEDEPGSEEENPSESEEPVQEEEVPEEIPTVEEDDKDELPADPETPEDIVNVTQNELFQGEETSLEADGFCDEEADGILHEIYVLTIPKELTAGKLTKPVFEDAEISVLVNGEESGSVEEVLDIGVKAEEIGIKVKPLGNTLKQVQKLILTLSNDTLEEKESIIETVLHRYFMDGTEDTKDVKKLTITLKGIRPITDPDVETDVDPEPENPEIQEPDEDVTDTPSEEEEKPDIKEEETKPQKNPVEHVFEIIDHSGLNLMEASVSVLDNRNVIFSSATEDSDTVAGTHYFQKEKIESVSVDEVDEKTEPKVSTSSSTGKGEKFVPFQLEKKNSEPQSENKKSNPVLPILLAVAAAAGAVFVPLAKKRQSDSREEEDGLQ